MRDGKLVYIAGYSNGIAYQVTYCHARKTAFFPENLTYIPERRTQQQKNRRQAVKTKHYLTPVRQPPDNRRNSQRASLRSDIATLSARFAEETRGERTGVRDPSGDDRKARGSKRDRSVHHFFFDQESFRVTVRLKTLRSAVES